MGNPGAVLGGHCDLDAALAQSHLWAEEGMGSGSAEEAGVPDPITVHHLGEPIHIDFANKEESVQSLVTYGLLDQGSADFLLKVSAQECRDTLAGLGPEVRNPSAFVTKTLDRIIRDRGYGVSGKGAAPAVEEAGSDPITVYNKGEPIQLEWANREEAINSMVSYGMLDQGSADFLLKVSPHEARECVIGLGPDVRNPSAFVTRALNRMVRDRAVPYGGAHAAITRGPKPEVITVYVNQQPTEIYWCSKEQAIQELIGMGLLDDGSGSFLMKAPDQHARDIIRKLGPDVRNPSALVTNQLRTLQRQIGF